MPPVRALSLSLAFFAGCSPSYTVSAPTVPAADGVRLATDVILPKVVPDGGVPIVVVQTRYWRSFQLTVRRSTEKMPIQPREDVAKALLDAGFGVVLVDVRGTGASEGVWERPWSDAEIADLGTTIDWIGAQPWCDGRVGAYGVSYEGTTALLAATHGGGPLKAVLAREIEWDLVDELLAPGGVRNVSFPDVWGRSVSALDRGEWPEIFPKGSAWLVDGPRWTDDDPDGTSLAAIVAERPIADVAGDVANVRGPDDPFGADGPPAGTVGPKHLAAALAGSGVAIGIWGGWWDGATADAVLRADAEIPLVQARIGPWNHEGSASADPLGGSDRDARVDLAEVVTFFQDNLAGDGGAAPRKQWWVSGAERWESGDTWPTATPVTLQLRADGSLGGAPDPALATALDVDFAASVGLNTRWMAGLLRPVDALDRAEAPGLASWTTAAFTAPLSVFGAPGFTCDVEVSSGEAALHVYLEAVDHRGHVRLLTEGVRRVTGGAVEVPLRAVAFELGSGDALRVSIAGADADTFERVPAVGAARLTLRGETCALTLPERS